MENQLAFVGFGTLEEFMKSISTLKVVNLLLTQQLESTMSGGMIQNFAEVVVASQLVEGEVLYCYIPVNYYQKMGGSIIEGEKTDARSGFDQIKAFIKAYWKNEPEIRSSIIAMPTNLMIMSAVFEGMKVVDGEWVKR